MLGALAFLHGRLAVAAIAYALLLALWASYAYLRNKKVSAGFRSAYLLLIALTAVQGLLGAAALFASGHPKTLLHLVYGAFAILFLPAVYLYAGGRNAGGRNRDDAREAALLAAAAWIVLIAYGRGFMTGG